ncbi:MAG: hypothetical protein ACKV2V_02585 [Blastocatellia bacterium]
MTSPRMANNFISAGTLFRDIPENGTANATDNREKLLMMFIGAGRQIWIFTSRRLLVLRKTRALTRLFAGDRLINLRDRDHESDLREWIGVSAVLREIPVDKITWLDAERHYNNTSLHVYAMGDHHELKVARKRSEIDPVVTALRHEYDIPAHGARAALKRDLRTWSFFFCLSGALTFLLSFVYPGLLEPVWGLTMLLLGATVQSADEPPMFVVLSVAMLWAALMSILGLNTSMLNRSGFPLSALFQGYWAVSLFLRYRRYAHLCRTASTTEATAGRPATTVKSLFRMPAFPVMPALPFLIAGVELVLLGLRFTALLPWPTSMTMLLTRGCLHLAMFGIAAGLACLLSGRTDRASFVTATVLNSLIAGAMLTLSMTTWHRL